MIWILYFAIEPSFSRAQSSRCGLIPQWAKRDSNPRLPACKAGALNQLSYSPVVRRILLQGEAYRKENAVPEYKQNRRGRRRALVQQPIPGREHRDGCGQEQPVSRSKMQARACQTLVGHKGRSLRGNFNVVKQLARRPRAPSTPRRATPSAPGRAAAA